MSQPGRGNTRARGERVWTRARGQTQSRGGRGRGSVTTMRPGTTATPPGKTSNDSVDPTGEKPAMSSRRRHMELMPSVSRSSGLDKDGDSLKNHKVQEEYRAFIEEKLATVIGRRKNLASETDVDRQHRVEEQENVLILFRKLREGISSSNRNDSFSLEVYERSLYLSVIFQSPKHTAAIIPALLNDLYPKSSEPSENRHVASLISLIHHLLVMYPSQSLYQQQLNSTLGHLSEDMTTWLRSLASSLRTGNYYRFNLVTQSERIMQLVKNDNESGAGRVLHAELATQALLTGIDALRLKARETIWVIVRSAYRELWLDEPHDTKGWLGRTLCLGASKEDSGTLDIDEWLAHVDKLGHIRRKENTDERWIVTKAK